MNTAHVAQNVHVIWLDSNQSQIPLQRVVHTIDRFVDVDQCIDFLTDIHNEKVFLILPQTIAEDIIPYIHPIPQLDVIYILGEHRSTWIHNDWKVKGIYTTMESIRDDLQQAIKRSDQNMISMSCIPSDEHIADRHFNQLDPTFMYTQILKEILLQTQYNHQSIHDFLTYCRTIDCTTAETLNKFQREYQSNKSIWWYTNEAYLYSMLNHALRTLNTNILLKIAFFMHDLHHNLRQLHAKQFPAGRSSSFIVYRGQGCSKADFERLRANTGGLLSFNNFLSTSLDQTISRAFAESTLSNLDSIGILFVMNINPSNTSIPFANIKDQSQFTNEKEILFSMHTVFRINQIKQLDGTRRLWQIELTLTSDDDDQLRLLTDRIRTETGTGKSWVRLGMLLMKIGHLDKAEEVYRSLLDQSTDPMETIMSYNQLGLIKQDKADYEQSIALLEKALELSEKFLPKNDPDRATIFGNLAVVHDSMGEHTKAISLFEQALEIRRATLPPDDPNLAISYMNLGMMYYRKGEYITTIFWYEKGYEIYKKILPLNHPDFARFYNHLACAHKHLANYSTAIEFHLKSIDIREKVLPVDHPDLTISYNNIASVYAEMGDYSQALAFHEKARRISEKVLPPNHPMLAIFYNNIANIQHTMGEYQSALSNFEKALQIQRTTLPSDHPDLATSYNNIAALYHATHDYTKALSTQKQAHNILENTIPRNDAKLATSYNNLAVLYTRVNDHRNALLSHEKALEIRERILPSNHPDLATSYNNIGTIYCNNCDYRRALPYFERALNILKQSVPPDHPHLQSVQETVLSLRRQL